MTKLWTASVHDLTRPFTYYAQCKSSKRELMQRLKADDAIWACSPKLTLQKKVKKAKFKTGLAIWCVENKQTTKTRLKLFREDN